MNKYSIYTLKALRKIYAKVFAVKSLPKPAYQQDADAVSEIIYNKLVADEPCMIARFGAFELNTIVNYLGVKDADKNIVAYLTGKRNQWWWDEILLKFMHTNAGFFPATPQKAEQFSELMLEDMKEVDVLGSWLPQEWLFEDRINKAQKVALLNLEPFHALHPWSRCLEKKKVLVVHPFAGLIEEQYKNRKLLFSNKEVLPEFDLQTLAAVQSLGGEHNGFHDWFEALNWMKDEIDKRDYDICLLGCGAYGFPLAAHIKRKGKKSIHLGGALQLLFGIKGKRWENPNYNSQYNYTLLMNDYWVTPGQKFTPANAQNVEGGSYW